MIRSAFEMSQKTQPRSAPEQRAVDLHGREARARLARIVVKLLDLWSLSSQDEAALLGLSPDSRSTLARYRRGEPLADISTRGSPASPRS